MKPRLECFASPRPRLLAALLLLTFGLAPPAGAQTPSALPLSSFPAERITIATQGAKLLAFRAWRAATPQLRSQGLMYVRELAADRAMIFLYTPPQPVVMWMKNTYVSLDMLFVDEQGCVATLVTETEPFSLDSIHSRVPVVLVVELAAGTAARAGISVGDRVLRPEAGWPRGGVLAAPCTPAKPIR